MSARRKLFCGFVFVEKTFARDLRTARSGRARKRQFTQIRKALCIPYTYLKMCGFSLRTLFPRRIMSRNRAAAPPTGGITMLDIQHLTKTYGEKKAVDDLSLRIAPGEIYGFIGHNGAGKTTTLKAAVGILQFDAGDIFIGGKSIRTDPLGCKRQLAYIPDNPDLYDFMSGIQYLNFIADIFGIPAAERWARIEPLADAFELTGDLGQPVSAYSHGMKQKLAIIAAWIHDPKLILMDEPFVGLDPKAAHLLKGMMRAVCDGGGAIFFSTHVLEVAEKLCDKVAIIRSGRLIRSGTMEEVKGDDSLEDVFLELEDASC